MTYAKTTDIIDVRVCSLILYDVKCNTDLAFSNYNLLYLSFLLYFIGEIK